MKTNENPRTLATVERERERERERVTLYWTWNSFTRPHTIMSTKEDVNKTSLLNMFNKARKQYKSCCAPSFYLR